MGDELLSSFKLMPESIIRISDLKEGIWTVRKIKDGKHMSFLLENVDNLPEAIELSKLEALRYKIAKSITNYFMSFDKQGSVLEEFNKLRVFKVSISSMISFMFKELRKNNK